MRRSVVVIIILCWINSSFSQAINHFSSDVHYKAHSKNTINQDVPFRPVKGFQDHATKQLYFQNELDFGSYEVLSFEFNEELIEPTSNTSNALHYDENYSISFQHQEENNKIKKTLLLLSCIRTVNGKNYRITNLMYQLKKHILFQIIKSHQSSSHNLFYLMDGTGINWASTKADCTK